MSLKLRSSQPPPGRTTRRVSEALSAWTNANGRLSVAWWQQLADHPAVGHGGGHRVRTHRLDDPLQPGAQAGGELLGGLGARDHVPALLGEDAGDDRIAVGRPDAPLAALELSEVHLAQLGQHRRLEPQPGCKRGRRLLRAPHARDEDGCERLAGQPLDERLRLPLALGRQRGVGLPLHERERAARDGQLRGAVAHEDHLGGSVREREHVLRIALGHAHRLQETASSGRVGA